MDKSKRKEALYQNKMRHPEIGVLAIVCIPTKEKYLFISKDVEVGFNRHLFQLNAALHPNKNLQKRWNQYGKDNFEFQVLEIVKYETMSKEIEEDLEELLEKKLIEDPHANRMK